MSDSNRCLVGVVAKLPMRRLAANAASSRSWFQRWILVWSRRYTLGAVWVMAWPKVGKRKQEVRVDFIPVLKLYIPVL